MDKLVLDYYGSAIGINTLAALEEQLELPSDTVSTAYAKKQTLYNRGHPIVPSSLLAEIWKCGAMKQVAGHNQHDAQEFFNAFVDCLSTNAHSYEEIARDMRQTLHEPQIKHSLAIENTDAQSDTGKS